MIVDNFTIKMCCIIKLLQYDILLSLFILCVTENLLWERKVSAISNGSLRSFYAIEIWGHEIFNEQKGVHGNLSANFTGREIIWGSKNIHSTLLYLL